MAKLVWSNRVRNVTPSPPSHATGSDDRRTHVWLVAVGAGDHVMRLVAAVRAAVRQESAEHVTAVVARLHHEPLERRPAINREERDVDQFAGHHGRGHQQPVRVRPRAVGLKALVTGRHVVARHRQHLVGDRPDARARRRQPQRRRRRHHYRRSHDDAICRDSPPALLARSLEQEYSTFSLLAYNRFINLYTALRTNSVK